ncbi:hypothetical protein [Chitinophaga agri]|uniref:Uncharacterized protein n=1 Tax=Chitinophaga agri TaxID=2703787 RepID=A0A6B9ZCQ8_9BACT|nr:hypothetical protein [Chitinophaga agri]QHS58373.1 hypothetical protein GWR21_01820 [Chitinophaga agri]
MNTFFQMKVSGKRAIKSIKTCITIILSLLSFSQCNLGSEGAETNGEVEETGYLMMDGSGYYFIRMDNAGAHSYKETLAARKDVTGFKFEFDVDSMKKIGLHYDTLTDLHKQQRGFPSIYVLKMTSPIKIVYSTDSVVAPYLKNKVSLPITFDKGEFTLVYTGGMKVSKIIPLQKD